MHLKDDELVDLAEGTRPESSAPHLASCDHCRRLLNDMRAMMSLAADVDVPEPSPLFWDHLSDRVREAVATQEQPRRSWRDVATWRRVLMPAWAAAVATVIVVVALSSRLMAPHAPALRPEVAPSATVADATATLESIELLNDAASGDDVSLTLVASLASGMDLDAAGEAGLAPSGSAEHAVTHMNDEDLRELRRLLKEEMAL